VCDLSQEQARRGHAVGVVCDAADADGMAEMRLDALEPHLALGLLRIPMSRELGPKDVSAYLTIRDHAFGLGINVVHGHGAKGGAYARLAARALKRAGRSVASCYTPHGGSLHYHPATVAGRVYMTLEEHLGRYTDALAFESAYAAARYEAQIGRPACTARVIPNGLRPEDFAAIRPDHDAADFLFVGELRRLKGVDVLLNALARVREHHAVRAVIVGAGPDAAACRRQAAGLGLDDSVTFRGLMPVARAFRLGRTLVVPSLAESLPYIVLEAAAAGLPMLATDVGGIPEIVAGTGTPLLPPGNVEALAQAMLEVLHDPAAAQDQALRLRQEVGRRFTISVMTDAVLDLYAMARLHPGGLLERHQ
jgi:glycosyltransferase involved in cell wall biosynthesis